MTRESTIRDLAAPLQAFGQLHADTLRQFGSRAVDLSYPNPRFHLDDRPYRVLAELASRATVDDLRYSPFGGFTTARRRVAGVLAEQHVLPYSYRDVILTPGATAALNVALTTLFTPPDQVMVVTPCWMDYPLYLANLGLGSQLVASTRDKHVDLDAIEQAWTPHTAGLIISQPASPTGVCYDADEVTGLAALLTRLGHAHGRPLMLINDETHRDHIWTGEDLASPAHAYRHTASVYSYGKAWQMQGQHTGYLAIHPDIADRDTLREQLVSAMRVTGYCAPTALTQQLLTELSPFTPDLGPLADLQHHTRHRLRESGYDVIDAAATHFVYGRVPSADDVGYVERAAQQGVLIMPSRLFHEPGYFRIALNTRGPALDRALDVLADLNTDGTGDHA
ncbi:aminotransferase class I/II-fold pyridoxal phosphate-dependent enzyme [Asanoa iriomotensis]|uniref:Aspartate aminotransferase n=1 Tax=Asanoa iriomotensis TaxID=234613 RepID=A0ABQ4CGB7_9ACTN|nr:aminotransferase class I/II-fold pyridoxal phosphate-dependent enzyme [Asanoa iriomotensis]GIF61828.1 aspartate aminotransferase [Asanoa iriomotensis]